MKPVLKGNARRSLSDEIFATISGHTRTTNLGLGQHSRSSAPQVPRRSKRSKPMFSIERPMKRNYLGTAEVGELRRKEEYRHWAHI